jgi:hypothetical protein
LDGHPHHVILEPDHTQQLAGLCGPLDAHLRQIDQRFLDDDDLLFADHVEFTRVPKVTSLLLTPAHPEDVKVRQDAFHAAYPRAVARVNARNRTLESGAAA